MALLTAFVLAQTVAATTASITTLAWGSSSQIQESREVVVRSEPEWETLWSLHSSEPRPEVDFSQLLVVAVFLGTRRTAGYEVEITAARSEGDRVVVEYVEQRPPGDSLVAQVLTAPFHLVSLPREVGEIDFRKAEVTEK